MRGIDPTERAIMNGLQGGFPLSSRPFRDAGTSLGLSEAELIEGIQGLVATDRVSRFGPLWNAERLGGGVCLCAMSVPPQHFDAVAEKVNAHPEVAHNYERTHRLNMWFVIAAESVARIDALIAEIERETGMRVYPMPKTTEFFIGFRVEV